MSAEHYMNGREGAPVRRPGDAAAHPRGVEPAVAKRLGREVQGFDEAAWAAARSGIVVAGNVAKFGRTRRCGVPRATGERVLVEASPNPIASGHRLAPTTRTPRTRSGGAAINLPGFARDGGAAARFASAA
jgi:predicted NAD-dependent protein-ADP-ribosyltransferase YbiA (DUF1768 family)